MTRFFAALFLLISLTTQAFAQDTVWVQVEAQRSLSKAQERAAIYDRENENVVGYSVGNGWYGIALGPYTEADAQTVLRQLRRDRKIPTDSFVARGQNYRQQFWPVGVGAETAPQPIPTADTPALSIVDSDDPVLVVEPDPILIPDETKAEARDSESLLDRDQRKDLQIALQWAGFYTSTIDGLYGRGTRASMRTWQEAKNHEPTGILTTAQRAQLLNDYNAVLDGMNLQLVRDDATGIEIQIPMGVVSFAKYEPPFARFDPKGDLEAQVLLISQEGDQNRLFGLYEILQTLAIIPSEGERVRRNASFEIEGVDDDLHSYVTVGLKDGQIKGFALIWPAGDDERRRRVLEEMQKSYNTIDGVLDPALATPGEDQAIDLIAGLAVRKPFLSRTGFYIGFDGTVLTSAEVVGTCSEITLDSEHAADVVHLDEALGIAVLRPQTQLSPASIAEFQTAVPRLQSEIAVAGYPYGGVLVTPSLTFGRLADIRGLNGEEEVKRLNLTAQEGDVGGPVFDNGGAVLGMLLPKTNLNGQVLPPEVSFSIDSEVILASLEAAGIAAQTTDTFAFMKPETLTLRAADQTVLVSCW